MGRGTREDEELELSLTVSLRQERPFVLSESVVHPYGLWVRGDYGDLELVAQLYPLSPLAGPGWGVQLARALEDPSNTRLGCEAIVRGERCMMCESTACAHAAIVKRLGSDPKYAEPMAATTMRLMQLEAILVSWGAAWIDADELVVVFSARGKAGRTEVGKLLDPNDPTTASWSHGYALRPRTGGHCCSCDERGCARSQLYDEADGASETLEEYEIDPTLAERLEADSQALRLALAAYMQITFGPTSEPDTFTWNLGPGRVGGALGRINLRTRVCTGCTSRSLEGGCPHARLLERFPVEKAALVYRTSGPLRRKRST